MSCRVDIKANNYDKVIEVIRKCSRIKELKRFLLIASQYKLGKEDDLIFLLSRERGLIYTNNDITKERIRKILMICDYVLYLIAKNS